MLHARLAFLSVYTCCHVVAGPTIPACNTQAITKFQAHCTFAAPKLGFDQFYWNNFSNNGLIINKPLSNCGGSTQTEIEKEDLALSNDERPAEKSTLTKHLLYCLSRC